MVDLKKRVLDWAKDKNDFFCIHDLQSFFSGEKEHSIAGTVGAFVRHGILTKTDVTSGCKMQPKRHSAYIINKRKAEDVEKVKTIIASNGVTIKKKRFRRGELVKAIIELAKSKNEFCFHTIQKEIGTTRIQNIMRVIERLEKMGILLRKSEKKHCPDGIRSHNFWKVNPDAKPLSEIKKKKKSKNNRSEAMKKAWKKRKGVNNKMSIAIKKSWERRKKEKVIESTIAEINLNEIENGTCVILSAGEQKFAICKENDKVRIFPVVK